MWQVMEYLGTRTFLINSDVNLKLLYKVKSLKGKTTVRYHLTWVRMV